MNRLLSALVAAGDPTQTHHWLLPETAEIIYGGIASVIVIAALAKFAGPTAKKALAARSERIQDEIDSARQAREAAEVEAADIRRALGDIGAERARLLGEADAQAASLLADGRARIASEMVDLEAKASADIVAAADRGNDELRSEISRLAALATERVVSASVDSATQQGLIEDFITQVGAR